MNDRLIINAGGETVRAMDVDGGKVRVQVYAHLNHATVALAQPDGRNGSQIVGHTVEVELARNDAAAFALQVLNAAGYSAAIELVNPAAARQERQRKGEDMPTELRGSARQRLPSADVERVFPADIAPMGRTMPTDRTAMHDYTVRKIVPSAPRAGGDLFHSGQGRVRLL
jgi:hypothetical protein